ncbi:hypothetical protein DFH08DRAFT_827164 [Mycena albidolilacea]|uniref:Uncharacterized protein n=1 Tax=Mycena albidolilacea TaxID=1033008 RepID=A0AAD7E7M1_9AGAR|nr:hypothetical protein DFH08DRAFT_827164 [Mycena albidolilacea]
MTSMSRVVSELAVWAGWRGPDQSVWCLLKSPSMAKEWFWGRGERESRVRVIDVTLGEPTTYSKVSGEPVLIVGRIRSQWGGEREGIRSGCNVHKDWDGSEVVERAGEGSAGGRGSCIERSQLVWSNGYLPITKSLMRLTVMLLNYQNYQRVTGFSASSIKGWLCIKSKIDPPCIAEFFCHVPERSAPGSNFWALQLSFASFIVHVRFPRTIAPLSRNLTKLRGHTDDEATG